MAYICILNDEADLKYVVRQLKPTTIHWNGYFFKKYHWKLNQLLYWNKTMWTTVKTRWWYTRGALLLAR